MRDWNRPDAKARSKTRQLAPRKLGAKSRTPMYRAALAGPQTITMHLPIRAALIGCTVHNGGRVTRHREEPGNVTSNHRYEAAASARILSLRRPMTIGHALNRL
jgi:hypothetical protein